MATEAVTGATTGLKAEIVTTGTEILLGEIVDTNAAWIAQQLRDAGVNLYYKTTVGDNEARVRGVIELGLSRSDIIIVSGGLGPTVDDITRQAIAAATRCPLYLHPGALETLKARFARFGAQMTENNIQQAMIPTGATLIENPVGTAPGFIVETAQGTVIALPGVPREMKHLMTATVLPYLRERAGNQGIIRRRVLRTMGIGESTIDHRLDELMHGANPTVGLAAHTAQCDVRITARAATAAAADALLDEMEAEIRRRIGDTIYGTTPEEPFEAVIAQGLQGVGAQVALLESNTQGQLARRFASATAAYAAVAAAWQVTDADLPAAVRDACGPVDGDGYGDAAAVAAATALRTATGATYALAVLGSAGENEGVYGTTSGRTWIGFATPLGAQAVLCPFGGRDEYTIVRIGNQALGCLWQELRKR
jgi:nicotinamide-nucleotide amidase